jgi:hypothetical protein
MSQTNFNPKTKMVRPHNAVEPSTTTTQIGYDRNRIIQPETGTEPEFRFRLTRTGFTFMYEIPLSDCNWNVKNIFQNITLGAASYELEYSEF